MDDSGASVTRGGKWPNNKASEQTRLRANTPHVASSPCLSLAFASPPPHLLKSAPSKSRRRTPTRHVLVPPCHIPPLPFFLAPAPFSLPELYLPFLLLAFPCRSSLSCSLSLAGAPFPPGPSLSPFRPEPHNPQPQKCLMPRRVTVTKPRRTARAPTECERRQAL